MLKIPKALGTNKIVYSENSRDKINGQSAGN